MYKTKQGNAVEKEGQILVGCSGQACRAGDI